ncbi:hypothetical protein HD598_000177 [Neomicrococcus aestuarii]|uniref:Polysaccharide pyruvyl transferase domain-containing protein n=1 Tax=Neomicrococcus aestuarii TaxID=556325 RepID=A0A7W8WYQ3_9MICC|nr:polysaccharide pyruvyl transferase family protein [Neomicrococcus aestuarii]MBB5511490.1 hypothetical protein [Neomicrococcus aestuarii]
MILKTDLPLIIGLTGAFERDNFGDLLYPMLLNDAWGNDLQVRLLSRFPADTEALLGLSIKDFDSSLLATRFDALVLAGGASVPISMARAAQLMNGVPEIASIDPSGLPYVPEVRNSKLNRDTPVFASSVGIWPSGSLRIPHGRRLHQALKGSQGITVRDRPSLALAHKWGVRASLAPDTIHAISLAWPELGKAAKDQVAVQISDEFIHEQGFETTTLGLIEAARVAAAHGLRTVILFAAGVSPGHDSLENLSIIAERMRAALEGIDVLVSHDRHPRQIVQLIAESRLVIGHSLHVRIVAASYNVPRVSLQRPKTEIYSADWDPTMPAGVSARKLADAVQQSLSLGTISSARIDSEKLKQRSMGMVKELEVSIKTWASARNAVASQRRLIYWQYAARAPFDTSKSAVRRLRAHQKRSGS